MPWVATSAGSRREEEEDEDDEEAAAAAAEAEATTPLIRAACAGPEGAVRLEDLPSCPTAEATSRARGDEAAAEEEEEVSEEEVSEEETEKAASASLQSTAARNPSPLPYPSAEASKVLHLPSGERACRPEMVQVVIGSSKALTPPTTAASASNDDDDEELFPPLPLLPPVVSALKARCAATSDAEHAVSVATHAPCRPNANETRPQR